MLTFVGLVYCWYSDTLAFRHPSVVIARARHDESTSNLVCHVDRCQPANSVESKAIASFAQASTYNAATHRLKIALWVVHHSRPFSIVEDEYLLEIFYDLNNKCITPSASTVSRDAKEIFMITLKKVAEMLQVCGIYSFSLAITHNFWSGPLLGIQRQVAHRHWWMDCTTSHHLYWSHCSLGQGWPSHINDFGFYQVCDH